MVLIRLQLEIRRKNFWEKAVTLRNPWRKPQKKERFQFRWSRRSKRCQHDVRAVLRRGKHPQQVGVVRSEISLSQGWLTCMKFRLLTCSSTLCRVGASQMVFQSITGSCGCWSANSDDGWRSCWLITKRDIIVFFLSSRRENKVGHNSGEVDCKVSNDPLGVVWWRCFQLFCQFWWLLRG